MITKEEVRNAIEQICRKRIETLSENTCKVLEAELINTDVMHVKLRVCSGVSIPMLEEQFLHPRQGFRSINLRTGSGSVWHGEMTGCVKIYTDFKMAEDPVFAERVREEKQAFERKLGAWVFLFLILAILFFAFRCAWYSYDEALKLTKQWQADAMVPAPADLLYTTLTAIFT